MATGAIENEKDIWKGGEGNLPMNASYGKLMMWFFLVSDAFTFSGFLIAYGYARFKHVASSYHGIEWPNPDDVFNAFPAMDVFHVDKAPLVFVGIMTFILILSSVTMVLAVEAGQRMDKAAVEKWMLWTILGGITFLGCQAWEWMHFIHGHGEGTWIGGELVKGANLVQNQYGPPLFGDYFFFITGFHGTHVLSGIIINIIIFYRVATGLYQRRGHYEMIEKVGLYWHFVDLVWVFVFTFFYLV
ncbi:MAG: cytochrome oxidase subunit III [Cytophagales bacterium]|nr:cytochrome oxidase subunit III [Cytophagales bacterium]